jgi:hypothetical protein
MTEGVIRHESLRLGEVLVELGLLSPAEVYDALALQVREKIVACFQWERFAYDSHESLDEPEDLGIYQCPPTEALVLAGVRAHYGPERVEAVLEPHVRAAVALREPVEALVPLFRPTAAEQRLLRAIDGTQTADALARSGALDPGPAGQLLAALALRLAGGRVFVSDVRPFRLQRAAALGAVAINSLEADPVDVILRETGQMGVDCAFEAVGLELTLAQALKALKKGGRAVLVGIFENPRVELPVNLFVQREISLAGSQGYCWDFQAALALLENRAVDLAALITHRLALEDLQQGFEILMDPGSNALKVVVEMGE